MSTLDNSSRFQIEFFCHIKKKVQMERIIGSISHSNPNISGDIERYYSSKHRKQEKFAQQISI